MIEKFPYRNIWKKKSFFLFFFLYKLLSTSWNTSTHTHTHTHTRLFHPLSLFFFFSSSLLLCLTAPDYIVVPFFCSPISRFSFFSFIFIFLTFFLLRDSLNSRIFFQKKKNKINRVVIPVKIKNSLQKLVKTQNTQKWFWNLLFPGILTHTHTHTQKYEKNKIKKNKIKYPVTFTKNGEG
jgi:hypothetical protein